jgi:hypothetical protein
MTNIVGLQSIAEVTWVMLIVQQSTGTNKIVWFQKAFKPFAAFSILQEDICEHWTHFHITVCTYILYVADVFANAELCS